MPFSATVDKRTAGGSPADVAVGATAHVGARSGGDGVAEQTEGSGERTENRGTEGGAVPVNRAADSRWRGRKPSAVGEWERCRGDGGERVGGRSTEAAVDAPGADDRSSDPPRRRVPSPRQREVHSARCLRVKLA